MLSTHEHAIIISRISLDIPANEVITASINQEFYFLRERKEKGCW